MSKTARMMYSDTEKSADLYYAVRFSVPDPFLYFEIGGRKRILMSDLEYGRALRQAHVHAVESLAEWTRRAAAAVRRGRGGPPRRPSTADVAAAYLKAHGVRRVEVPAEFPAGLADALRARGIRVAPQEGVFFPQRARKTPSEVACIRATQRATEAAVALAEKLLRESRIQGNRLVHRGRTVTSELLKRVIHVALLERNCIASHTIAASGDHATDPHHEGTGPIRPRQALILDVFPRSGDTRYFADMTRTFVKGKPSPRLVELYEAVKAAQEEGLRRVRAGANGRDVHAAIVRVMEGRGFRTMRTPRGMTGFFHGTGHGLGLEVHEPPRVNASDHVLREREVVTVEPGLYYPGLGGVRLEDLVVVRRGGCENLTRYPKRFVIP